MCRHPSILSTILRHFEHVCHSFSLASSRRRVVFLFSSHFSPGWTSSLHKRHTKTWHAIHRAVSCVLLDQRPDADVLAGALEGLMNWWQLCWGQYMRLSWGVLYSSCFSRNRIRSSVASQSNNSILQMGISVLQQRRGWRDSSLIYAAMRSPTQLLQYQCPQGAAIDPKMSEGSPQTTQ